ncbi:MAG: helix-turn-helix domain-containing protein [Rhizobiaceae bacterium]
MDEEAILKGIAAELDVSLFKMYSEPEAAHLLQLDLTTLKRLRQSGRIPLSRYRNLGERKIRYLGLDIVRLINDGLPPSEDGQVKTPTPKPPKGDGANQTNGEAPWQTEHSKSAKAG